MFDINALLERIHTNNDVNVQIKLFSTLSTYIILKKMNISEIITYNSLYDKICNLLPNCPPRKASVLLNFLSALMFTINEDGKTNSLITYAKNMIRSSGCLATMCEFFTNCMMNQDAWRSLCRCLAETCRNVEANQSYCTHLVPTCVQRCSQRNIDVLLVLQSLLQNHERNVDLFIECNGMSLFRREILQHDICLQLLNTLVQSSVQANVLISKTDVSRYLFDFLRLYGPDSQLGQWATIILYHMPGTKGTCVIPIPKQQITDQQNHQTQTIAERPDLENTTDTTGFFQNVMKEIMHCGLLPTHSDNIPNNLSVKNNNLNHKQLLTNKIWTHNTSPFNHLQKFTAKSTLIERKRKKSTPDLSFSFLCKEYNRCPNASVSASKITNTFQIAVDNPVNITKFPELCESSTVRDMFRCHDTPELSSFTPKFVSTPKKYNKDLKKSAIRNVQNSKCTSFSKSIGKHKRKFRSRTDLSKVTKLPKRLEQTINDKENKHRSISGRFFEAVNDSCTTLVKTIKNIFRPKQSSEKSKVKSLTPVSDTCTRSCSYSFTNYMRERDAILKNEGIMEFDVDDFSIEMSNSCSSCNDTVALKHKLANDEFLKQTIRKLKLGINLYGCDFKKISKQLWPQQTYMTPVVLYNLYRKLIIK